MSADERPRVVLVNRCFVRDGEKLLIIQRAKLDSMNAEKWEVPGGKLDEGQDLSHAQEREVMEETGFLDWNRAAHRSSLCGPLQHHTSRRWQFQSQ